MAKHDEANHTPISERVHAVLDGTLDEAALTPEQREQYQRLTGVLREATGPIRKVRPPDLTARVMAALPHEAAVAPPKETSGISSLVSWLWSPRELSLAWRPAYGLAAVALVVLGISFGGWPEGDNTAAVGPTEPAILFVQFRLDAPGASQVRVAGSFTDWQPEVELTESSPGIWSALVPLEPGVHDYTFVVDGERWIADPAAPAVQDGFGGMNSRLFLTSPRSNA